jgi:hypothetical protein
MIFGVWQLQKYERFVFVPNYEANPPFWRWIGLTKPLRKI